MTKRDLMHQAIGRLAALEEIDRDLYKLTKKADELQSTVFWKRHDILSKIKNEKAEIQSLKAKK